MCVGRRARASRQNHSPQNDIAYLFLEGISAVFLLGRTVGGGGFDGKLGLVGSVFGEFFGLSVMLYAHF
jgi:hypothetical protein